MSWWGGHGNRAPETAKAVAEAFFAGKKRKRSNCRTDGEHYYLEDTCIARRIKPEDIPKAIAAALEGMRWGKRPLEFSYSSWPTQMTARHLKALGVNAECYGRKSPVAKFNGVEVDSNRWYTPAEIAALGPPPPPLPKPSRAEERRCNKTMELFA
jgi:hypothetical protein